MTDPFAKTQPPDLLVELAATDFPRPRLLIRERCFFCVQLFELDTAEGVPDGPAVCPKCAAQVNRKIAERVYLATGNTVGAVFSGQEEQS